MCRRSALEGRRLLRLAAETESQASESRDQVVNSVDLSDNHLGKVFSEVSLLKSFRQEFCKSLDGDKRVFDFMCYPRDQGTKGGKSFCSAFFTLKGLYPRQSLKTTSAPLIEPRSSRRADVEHTIGTVVRICLEDQLQSEAGVAHPRECDAIEWRVGVVMFYVQCLERCSWKTSQRLSGRVRDGDLTIGIDGHNAAVHGRENVLDIFVDQDDATVELGVVEGGGGLIGERC